MQGHGQRRATCRCSQKTELFVVSVKDFKRILQPLQQDTLQSKIAFLQQVWICHHAAYALLLFPYLWLLFGRPLFLQAQLPRSWSVRPPLLKISLLCTGANVPNVTRKCD